MAQPSAPPGRPAAAPTFAAFRARTPMLSGAARAEAFDRLSEGAREEAWRALGRECADRAEHECLEGRTASRPRYADLRSAAWRERAVAVRLVACESCGRPFEAKRSTARYCGPTCRSRAHRRRVGE